MQNSYKAIGPNGKTNGANFYSFCAMQLGNDYANWQQHTDFEKVVKQAHKVLNFNGNVRGLKLRALFLAASNSSSKETRAGHSCYNDALYDALEADIIDIETFKKQLIKPTFNKN